ncbi:MAG: hypothetical protein ACO3AF_04145 [Flavobacteriales bacterium]
MEKPLCVGIDFGAKLAGTTAVCMGHAGGQLELMATKKGQDADRFLEQTLRLNGPVLICIDAPLSLPMAYVKPMESPDFFYRQADREAKAMSPLFLGGLTARACKLAHRWRQQKWTVIEGYPGGLVQDMKPGIEYKKDKSGLVPFMQHISQEIKQDLPNVESWHEVDAILAWWIACKYVEGKARGIGNQEEGKLWI